MKVTFVVPFLNWTGGMRVILHYAEELQRRGHSVAICFPLVPYLFADRLYTVRGLRRWLGDLRLNIRHGSHRTRLPFSVSVRMVPWIASRYMPDGDAVIATAWPTAYSVSRLSAAKGAKFHLIQHHETWSGPSRLVEGSYRLPHHKIVVASWLRELLTREYGEEPLDTITNGVDLSLFRPCGKQPQPSGRVLMQYSRLPWKGLSDGFRAWEAVRREFPAASLVLFGLEKGPDVPADAEFHLDPPQDELRRLYSSCDVFVSTSWAEGCQLPPAEAMACRCAVVATNVGGVPDYAIPGRTALVAEPHDVEGLAQAILRLLRDESERSEIAEAGYRHIQQFSWDRAARRLEAALEQGIRQR